MPKDIAPSKNTSGGGFVFEDKVCAWFLTHMLANECPLGAINGRLTRIDLQARPDGWFFDDVVLTLAGGTQHRCALSIKSNNQFRGSKASLDLVRTAWEQFLGGASSPFNETTDFIGVVTTPLPAGTREAIEFVLRTARDGDPQLLPGRYEQGDWANEAKRSLFESFACPEDLASIHGVTRADIGRLLARFQFRQFDFEAAYSESEAQAVERCRRALRGGDTGDATRLWARILQISANRRPNAGCLDRLTLLGELRHEFELSGLPEHEADWQRLQDLSAASMAQVRDLIGGLVHLQREIDLGPLQDVLKDATGVVLLGPSGVGKSAIAKELGAQRLVPGSKCLWFDARSFERGDFAAFQADLQLSHSLAELIREIPDREAILILDGLDRLYDTQAFAIVGSLVNAMHSSEGDSPWRIVTTCQTEEWARLHQCLLSAHIPAPTWRIIECKPFSIESLQPVWQAIPRASRLRHQRNLRPLLSNLKILDLIATRLVAGEDVQTTAWVGESSVASWYWESLLAVGQQRAQRARFTMLLAERQADTLTSAIALDSFSVPELAPLDDLERDRICRRTDDDRVLFVHDLLGDWARLRVLLGHSEDLVSFLDGRFDSPLWHRAIRLYGAHLLEHIRDTDRWRVLLSALRDQGGTGVRDLLLESIVFAADPMTLLEHVHVDLLRDEGSLLRRLLGRFLAFATLPDPLFVAFARTEGYNDTHLAALCRYPNWPYWPPVLQFLYHHRAEALRSAPVEIARVVDLWLAHTPEGSWFRREAAELGLALGTQARCGRRGYSNNYHENQRLFYRVALAGALELPDEVVAFARSASKRSDEPRDAETEASRPPTIPSSASPGSRPDSRAPLSGPWPDGPGTRVDDDLREVVLDSGALSSLMSTRPAVAREVILACLISPPRRSEWHDYSSAMKLEVSCGRRWSTPHFVNGPFRQFLKTDFHEGLETIARLVDFAGGRWLDHISAPAGQLATEAASGGSPDDPLRHILKKIQQPSRTVVLPLEQGPRELIGDSHVYAWSTGVGSAPHAIGSALMALEQYFYVTLDAGQDIENEVRAVLDRTRTVAFLKVLCDIGKRENSLFDGPLRPLLAIPEVYEWERDSFLHGRDLSMVGAFLQGEWFIRTAQSFHSLPHRRIDLCELAQRRFLSDADMREYLSAAREQWEERLHGMSEGPSREFLEQLVVAFNIDNYQHVHDPKHGDVYVNTRAQEMYAKKTDQIQALQRRLFLTTLPGRCRQILDGRVTLGADHLDGFWAQVQEISGAEASSAVADHVQMPDQTRRDGESIHAVGRGLIASARHFLRQIRGRVRIHRWSGLPRPTRSPAPKPPSGTTAPQSQRNQEELVNALAGVAAVFVRFHRDYLAEHPDRRQWCMDHLRTPVLNPPPPDFMDNPDSAATWTWDCFAAEALPILWAEAPDDVELRYVVAQLVFAPHYGAVKILFQRCAEHRVVLGADFHRLRRLVFELAYMRDRQQFVQQTNQYFERLTHEDVSGFGTALEAWANERIAAFVRGTLEPPTDCWVDMDQPVRFTVVDEARRQQFRGHLIDFHLICAAHEWLPGIEDALDDRERHEWLGFWHSALESSLSRIRDHGEREEYPCEEDRWVLARIAATLPHLTPSEHPEGFWRPILDLSDEAHYWTEEFLQSFHRSGLAQEVVSPRFTSLRAAILEHALAGTDGRGSGRWVNEDGVWQALIGVDSFTRDYWEKRHRRLAEESGPLLQLWIDRIGASGPNLAALAAWLEKDAAAPVRLRGLVWLDCTLLGDDAREIYDGDSVAQAVACLLSLTWKTDESSLRRDAPAFSAFQHLLRWLAEQQNPLALQLLGEIGGLS